MKKLFFVMALALSMASFAAVEAFRLDLYAVKDATFSELTLPEGATLAVQKPSKEVKEGITRAYIFSEKLTAEWKKYTLSFVPEEDGRITLMLHTPGSKDPKNVKSILVDDIQITGGKLKNGNFETLKNDKLAAWRSGANVKVVTDKAAEGKNCAQLIYFQGGISQAIYVTADEKVTISFQARLAD